MLFSECDVLPNPHNLAPVPPTPVFETLLGPLFFMFFSHWPKRGSLTGFNAPLGANGCQKLAFWVPKGVQKVTKNGLFAKVGKVDLDW